MNSLKNPAVVAVLKRLHADAAHDAERWAQRKREQASSPPGAAVNPLIRLGSIYMAFAQEEGELLYLLARSLRAQVLVEFGASFGVSTVYLAAAARDTGGRVVTTEVHPEKCLALRANLAEAGLVDLVSVLEGDARETLRSMRGPVDMLILDGWKSMYLPVLDLLRPQLRDAALVVADNISHEATRPYMDVMQRADSGFVTRTVGDLALSCLIA